MVIPVELMSMIGGSVSGFLMKYLAIKAQDEREKFDRMMKSIDKIDESADKAASRTKDDPSGNWTRRFIIIFVLFGCILAPFVLAMLDKPIITEVVTPSRNFFGIFEWGGHTRFYQLPSYLLSKELLSSLIAIVSFYFGSSVAKR